MSTDVQSTNKLSHEPSSEAVASAVNAVLYMRGKLAQRIFSIVSQAGNEGIKMRLLRDLSGLSKREFRIQINAMGKHQILARQREDKRSGETILSLAKTVHASIIQDLGIINEGHRAEVYANNTEEENRAIHEIIMAELTAETSNV